MKFQLLSILIIYVGPIAFLIHYIYCCIIIFSIGTAEPVLKLLYPPVSITVDEGGDINLKCIFKGPNDTIISWNKKDGSLPARARTSVPMTIDKKWFIMVRTNSLHKNSTVDPR